MKKSIFLSILSFCMVGLISAQTTKSTTNSAKKDVQPKVYKVVNPENYESVLVNGKLILFTKLDKDSKTGAYTSSYSIGSTHEKSMLTQKHLDISMNPSFFESTFLRASPEITEKSNVLRKFVSDKNISLTDEKGWISLIKYFNEL